MAITEELQIEVCKTIQTAFDKAHEDKESPRNKAYRRIVYKVLDIKDICKDVKELLRCGEDRQKILRVLDGIEGVAKEIRQRMTEIPELTDNQNCKITTEE